jgi:hypothetical protein
MGTPTELAKKNCSKALSIRINQNTDSSKLWPTVKTPWLRQMTAFFEPNASNDDVVCIKKEAVRRKAVLWPPIEKHEGKKLVFPFLDRDICDRDFQLASHMVMEQVFVSSHGSKNKIWEGIRTLLAEKRDDNGELVFPDGINSIQTLRRRADVLLKWIKKRRDTAALRSGTDNEVHSEFITLLECC